MNAEDLRSRYVQVDGVPWTPTEHAGIEMKILFEEPASGLLTALVRLAPGASLPLHEHWRFSRSQTGSLRPRSNGRVSLKRLIRLWKPLAYARGSNLRICHEGETASRRLARSRGPSLLFLPRPSRRFPFRLLARAFWMLGH
jgi:hypothetical protein